MDGTDGSFPMFDENEGMVSGVQVITNSPEAIRRILGVLNMRDLLSCKRVCKSWKLYAEKILTERQRVRTLLARKREKSNWMAMGDVADVKLFFKDLDIRSIFVLLFGKLPLSRPCAGGNDLFSLKELLPTDSTIIGSMSSAGIIGGERGKCDAIQNPRLECLSCMVFPKMDALKLRYFHLSLERYEQVAFAPETADLEAMFGIQDSERVKCLVLISPSYMPFDVARQVFAAFWLRERGRVAMCGGIVEDVIELGPHAREVSELGLTGIAFCGDDRVSAGSIVIPPHAKSKTKVQSLLHQFPPTLLQSSSPSSSVGRAQAGGRFGLVFSCAGRGSRMFKTASVEAELVQAQFPDTPFVGVFSLGECGLTYWPSPPPPTARRNRTSAGSSATATTDQEEPLLVDHMPEVLHSFTTVVAIVNVNE